MKKLIGPPRNRGKADPRPSCWPRRSQTLGEAWGQFVCKHILRPHLMRVCVWGAPILTTAQLSTPFLEKKLWVHFRRNVEMNLYFFHSASITYHHTIIKIVRGVPVVVQRKQTWPASMRMQVPSLASLSGLRIQCCRNLQYSSQIWLGTCVVMA